MLLEDDFEQVVGAFMKSMVRESFLSFIGSVVLMILNNTTSLRKMKQILTEQTCLELKHVLNLLIPQPQNYSQLAALKMILLW